MQKVVYRLFLVLFLLCVGCKQQQERPQKKEVAQLDLQEMKSPAKAMSSLPHVVSNKDLTLLSWVEAVNDSVFTVKYAQLQDGEWQGAQTIITGSDWFVNWADYPMIAENNGHLWSHVLKKSSKGTYSYDIQMNIKPRNAQEWTTGLALHTDATPTEHGFVSVTPYKDAFFVNWLDGRNTMENEVGERGAMTLRAGVVSVAGKLAQEEELDASTCDCCQTTSAITDNGPVVLYRDRTEDEVRDISIVRQVKGQWTAPKTIHDDNWVIKGCPVNGPKVSAMGNNLVAAWFTAAQETPRVQVIFSDDGGEHFSNPVLIADEHVMGRVDVLWVDEETAVVSWMESEAGKASFKVMQVNRNGTLFTPRTIAVMDGSRKSGFPQMEIEEGTLYFAWTDYTDDTYKVRTAKMLVTALATD
ncbi:hypothetical protein [Maribacter sp. MAR_2009_72]|uniref:hypothetical protein n=1 Tax=Maribacter sp. MAR_2009_72 TaxID=1250050 RepID=UPI00119AD367|nr:hypothetical protein [Maribacter sp. MAR_2009_72]TVZ14348.1 hypothetical protein JM81_0551 [Maribacter sp. MAR_2009_72]